MTEQEQRVGRRQWLAGAALGGMAVLTRSVSAREPIARTGKAKFKSSMAAYSYRKLLSGKNPQRTLFDFMDDCAAFGLDGTELTSYYFPDPVTPGFLRKLKHHAFLLGLDISGTAVGNDFGHPPGPQRDRQLEMVKEWVVRAELMGAPVIRVFAGHQKKGQDPRQTHRWMVEGLEECCDYAGRHGVHLALENHGGPTATVEGLLSIVRDVKSPWFGVNLDTGNFRDKDPYAAIKQAAPYAINVQVKVSIPGPDGKSQPADFDLLAQILADSGYRGYIVLEYEEAGDVRAECRKYTKKLEEAFGIRG